MGAKGHRNGGKFKGHTTIIEASGPIIDALAELEVVTWISIGIIVKTKGVVSATSTHLSETLAGFQLKVRGNKYIQTFYVYVPHSKGWMVERLLKNKFPNPNAGQNSAKKKGKTHRAKTNPPGA